jgi:hypothetical protein
MKKQKSNISATIDPELLNVKRERDNPFSELEASPKKQKLDVPIVSNPGNFSSNFSSQPQPGKASLTK